MTEGGAHLESSCDPSISLSMEKPPVSSLEHPQPELAPTTTEPSAAEFCQEIRELRMQLSQRLELEQAEEKNIQVVREQFVQRTANLKSIANKLIDGEQQKTACLTRLGSRMCTLKERVSTYLDSAATIAANLQAPPAQLIDSTELIQAASSRAPVRQPVNESVSQPTSSLPGSSRSSCNGSPVVAPAEPSLTSTFVLSEPEPTLEDSFPIPTQATQEGADSFPDQSTSELVTPAEPSAPAMEPPHVNGSFEEMCSVLTTDSAVESHIAATFELQQECYRASTETCEPAGAPHPAELPFSQGENFFATFSGVTSNFPTELRPSVTPSEQQQPVGAVSIPLPGLKLSLADQEPPVTPRAQPTVAAQPNTDFLSPRAEPVFLSLIHISEPTRPY
eukprot:TRINITY_DN32723_c0_g1_i1.p1 TRINITY_DN32723_c0_g1~~TRINITY_DN32723_c0_g1_i1.p1  ORF type:complete len:392 (-),score=73.76 TRINITY_DN32723_c0_g1_i1:59-1234(-)